MRKLRIKNKKKYLDNPKNCPYCGQDSKQWISDEYRRGRLKRKFSCIACGTFFIEKYKLYDVEKYLESTS